MIRTPTEAELLAAVARGDQEAYCQLVRKYQDRLLTMVQHVLQDRAEAEDVVQEAFLRAYVHLGSFAGRSSFFTWLYRIALHLAIRRGRRRSRFPSSLDQTRLATGEEPADRGDLPGDRLVQQESLSQIETALAALAPDQRAVLLLRAVEGFDYEQIAQVLELNIGTVRSRLHRARMHLRELLQVAT